MGELTLGSLNLHMGRGPGGHAAPFYDVVTACKEIDTDVLVLQEAWVPDADEGDVVAVAPRLPVLESDVVAVGPQLSRDPGRRAVVRAVVDAGAPFTVVGTHLPLLKDP